MRATRVLRRAVLFALLFMAGAANLGAQNASIALRGQAVNPQGQPLAGVLVVMHRVGAAGGAQLARDTTDATGAFSLTATDPVDTAAVYVAAARSDGQLYIGPFVRAPGDNAYRLEIGGQPVALDAPITPGAGAAPLTPAPAARSPWRFALVPGVALLALAAFMAFRSSRPSTRRRLLIRLAAVDEDLAAGGAEPLRKRERERILERLLSE
jgi:hypothetical protein